MNKSTIKFRSQACFGFLFISVFSLSSFAQTPVVGRRTGQLPPQEPGQQVNSQNQSGREAAAGYMNQQAEETRSYNEGPGSRKHYMALHLGKLVNADSWNWGEESKNKNVGSATVGVTYRVREWWDTTDLVIRLDLNEYDVDGKKPQKLSFLPMILFPESASEFPLYFGAGVGVGVFFKQLDAESVLSIDYQLVVGMRFFDVFDNVGLFLESGLKNHIQLTDNGQVNASFISAGALFTF